MTEKDLEQKLDTAYDYIERLYAVLGNGPMSARELLSDSFYEDLADFMGWNEDEDEEDEEDESYDSWCY